ncbi:Glycosyltransferase involved in cell wall bisynthesis [Ferrimonas sediminum]|uniref:Glycosyltransferase involved in cell wall bisynthesis n=1 Tax=Ferrimonas sediminum TaxID=718193 RepID=A0A1G8S7H4_9GAMM|nr:glycosyltransferase [Ferrimonas sediminum]SDJ24735.1 Glycosyltransferase involved in cell wall bisynthesis [Ferrimonas sediminum]
MKPKMVVFGEDWGRHPSSSQHLIRALAKHFEVVWINSIGLRQPRWQDLTRLASKAVARSPGPSQAPFKVIAPKVWPLARSPWLQRLNRARMRRSLADVGPVDFVWCALPSAEAYLDLFPGARVIYYCGDDFGSLSGVDHAEVLRAEQRLVARAEWVFCASDILTRGFDHPAVFTVRHGVDLRHFSRPCSRPGPLPRGVVLGYYGSLAPWLDYGLLDTLTTALPECQLVLIGDNQSCPRALLDKANVHHLGRLPHDELAAYAQHFDVALLPFLPTPQIAACDPLKLREYLAAGVPVVGTDFDAARGYACGVQLATTREEFVAMVLMSLLSRPKVAEIRMQVLGQGWDDRAELVLSKLQPDRCKLQSCRRAMA